MATIRNRHQPTRGTAEKAHVGVDFVVCDGQHVVSVGYGVVSNVLQGSEFGPRANGGSVMIFHFDPKTGVVSADLVYAHLAAIQIRAGDTVRRGQIIGEAWKPDEPDEEWIPHVHLQWLGLQSIEERDPLRLLSGCMSTAKDGDLVYPVSC